MNLLVAGNTHGAPSDARRAVPATRGSSLSPEEACQSGRLQTWTALVTNSSTQRTFTSASANLRIFGKTFYRPVQVPGPHRRDALCISL